jgi:hypothetical protein
MHLWHKMSNLNSMRSGTRNQCKLFKRTPPLEGTLHYNNASCTCKVFNEYFVFLSIEKWSIFHAAFWYVNKTRFDWSFSSCDVVVFRNLICGFFQKANYNTGGQAWGHVKKHVLHLILICSLVHQILRSCTCKQDVTNFMERVLLQNPIFFLGRSSSWRRLTGGKCNTFANRMMEYSHIIEWWSILTKVQMHCRPFCIVLWRYILNKLIICRK